MGMPMRCGRAVAVGGWAGGRVGGGEAAWGAWGQPTGGTTPPRSHRTYRILPHPGGVGGAYPGGPPRLLRAAVRSDVAVVLTVFPPGSRRQGWPTRADLAPWGGGEPAYVPRPPPTPLCYILGVRRTGERIRHGSRLGKASLCPPPRGVLPRPHEAPRWVRGHAFRYTGVYG